MKQEGGGGETYLIFDEKKLGSGGGRFFLLFQCLFISLQFLMCSKLGKGTTSFKIQFSICEYKVLVARKYTMCLLVAKLNYSLIYIS